MKKLLCVVALMAAVIAMQAQEVKQMENDDSLGVFRPLPVEPD